MFESKTNKGPETESAKKDYTLIFIETPYRNNQLLDTLLSICGPSTILCIAADLTGEKQFIKTRSIADWKINKPDIHKRPTIFLLYAS